MWNGRASAWPWRETQPCRNTTYFGQALLQGPPMQCKTPSTAPCTSNVKARFMQHASARVDGRESLGDVLNDGYEEPLEGLVRSRPAVGEREKGTIPRWGRELSGPEYNGLD